MKKRCIGPVIAVCFVLFAASTAMQLKAQIVMIHPDCNQPLQKRWKWALEEASRMDRGNGFWIAYSIEKEMNESSFIGSYRWPQSDEKPSLAEMITGRKITNVMEGISDDEAARNETASVFDRMPKRRVKKEVAFCFYFPQQARPEAFSRIVPSNLSLHVDLEGAPLIWLHRAAPRESIPFLTGMYKRANRDSNRERLITAVGVHQSPEMVIPFLTDVLRSRAEDDVRKKAAFWLGGQDHRDALKALLRAVRSDRSIEVRKHCVFAISQLDMEEARDALIELVKNAKHTGIREKAVFWLGQKGGDNVLALLLDVAQNDTEDDIQEKAVFAISQMKDEAATDALIKLAHGDSPKVRKKAVFWLSQKASKKVIRTLEDIAENSDDTEMQKKAVFALYQLPKGDGIAKLIEISQSHRNPEIRKKAIFWLGQSGDNRAVDAIVALLRN